ncbi:MAG: hypothetical protein ACT4P1_07425 [Sporichthyaceae bacterium]
MLRVSEQTRDHVLRIAREDFGGATADETIRLLVEEHWRAKAIGAVEGYRRSNPQGWADYLAEAGVLVEVDAPVADGWNPRPS